MYICQTCYDNDRTDKTVSQAWPDPRIKGGSGKLRIPNSGRVIWLRVGLIGGASQ